MYVIRIMCRMMHAMKARIQNFYLYTKLSYRLRDNMIKIEDKIQDVENLLLPPPLTLEEKELVGTLLTYYTSVELIAEIIAKKRFIESCRIQLGKEFDEDELSEAFYKNKIPSVEETVKRLKKKYNPN